MSRGQTARLRSWSLCGTGTRRGRVPRVGASSGPTCTGPGTRRGPVCRRPASSGQTCTGPVHMGALLAGIRELGPDECHHWLNHVRNCETCTGPFVKTLIAQLIYLMLCGIRLISHGTRLARVCIFRYTSADSCHGWNSYGTRRPRVCGIPCVTSSCVPAGGMPGTLLPPVYGIPANWGQECTAKAPPLYSPGPSFVRACKLAADVYRHAAPPALERPEFTPPLQTRRRRVPTPIASVLTRPEFTDPLQTRGRSVPGAWCPPAAYSSSDQFSLSSRSSSWKMEMYFSRVLLMMESATESSYAWLIRLRDSSASS